MVKNLFVAAALLFTIWIGLAAFTVFLDSRGFRTGLPMDDDRSACKSRLSCLKSALIAFNCDTGNYPHVGSDKNDDSSYFFGTAAGLGLATETNCLYTPASDSALMMGMTEEAYKRRWKGPYLDSDPTEYFTDPWGKPVIYANYNKKLYLWSAGEDGRFEDPEALLKREDRALIDSTDDIVTVVGKVRRSYDKTDMKKLILAAEAGSMRGSEQYRKSIFTGRALYCAHPIIILNALNSYFSHITGVR